MANSPNSYFLLERTSRASVAPEVLGRLSDNRRDILLMYAKARVPVSFKVCPTSMTALAFLRLRSGSLAPTTSAATVVERVSAPSSSSGRLL